MSVDIIFWGATGQAKVLRELLGDTATVVAVFDRAAVAPPFPDVPLHVGDAGLDAWLASRAEPPHFLVAIGGEHGRARVEIQHRLAARRLVPHIAIHRTAFVAVNARLGAGSQILAHATVCAEAQLGEACIVNTAASVDHECNLGDGVHVGAGRSAGRLRRGRRLRDDRHRSDRLAAFAHRRGSHRGRGRRRHQGCASTRGRRRQPRAGDQVVSGQMEIVILCGGLGTRLRRGDRVSLKLRHR